LNGHRGRVAAIAVSPDGHFAASAGWDRTVRIWDLEERAERHELAAVDNVNSVAFVADGTAVVAGGSDGSVQSWRVADGTQLGLVKEHDLGATALDPAPGGHSGAAASAGEAGQPWDLERGVPVAPLHG